MNYLEITNKVIQESASEADELTSGTWSTAEAGRRIYPRIKRNVAQAWKDIQMRHDEWEFNTKEFSEVLYPRIRIKDGLRAAGDPAVGAVFVGDESGFELTIRDLITNDDWDAGGVEGMIEFEVYDGNRLIPGETFTELSPVPGDGSFTYLGKGGYSFQEVDPYLREIQWATFYASVANANPTPVRYLPYDHWSYNEYNFHTSSQSAPNYVSQDYQGFVVFYPQTFNPFRVSFIYHLAPQILEDNDDVPDRIPEEYHEWIAWEALKKYALFDKNPNLFSYAQSQAMPYWIRAERDLMPLISYAPSAFNR
jgi:hypothetical protein